MIINTALREKVKELRLQICLNQVTATFFNIFKLLAPVMLAEGFLTRIGYGYHQSECIRPDGCANSKKTPKTSSSSWEELFDSLDSTEGNDEENIWSGSGASATTSQEKGKPTFIQKKEETTSVDARVPLVTRKTSDSLNIPKNYTHIQTEVDLYQSWSTTCQSYTDLQMVGDNVTPYSPTSLPTCLTNDHESCNWPIFQINSASMWPHLPASYCEGQQCSRSDTFHQSDRSITLQKEPLSNSVINNYMEQKITELYKQYLEDSMTKYASPTNIMGSHFLMTSIDQISLQISQDKNMEPAKAKDMVLNCLLSVACATNSSDICTPNLQISNQLAPGF
ncbi:TLR adapter interacting with SLC15A4 on the lysosome-like [Pristis pectinata]|uniref:TLR adapter interacting with SLC15A4 on the lysosome-like n=1 Tax=Pristis pectinata TaxID=685728 RepID=UPI00223DBA94|nr:TLR adapter interacting with SLC15A4 on the lysosome-like [Pristis pectinata]